MSLASKIISAGIAIALAARAFGEAKTLLWDYFPLPEDRDKPVAFNLWESHDLTLPLIEWNWIGTTTNHCFKVDVQSNDYFALSVFFTETNN